VTGNADDVDFSGVSTTALTVATVSWGDPATKAGQSAYRFTSEALPISEFFTDVGSQDFKIGTFQHLNNPIYTKGGSITGVRLTLNYGVGIDVGNTGVVTSLGNFMSVYDFSHHETPNAAHPCAYGGANGQGVNINGCADRVTFAANQGLSDRFTVGDKSYQLEIGGFSSGGAVVDEFLTVEHKINSAILVGNISVVPEPASWAMLIAGFGLVGATMRRRRRQGAGVLA
jgi:hypothetical protein